MGDTPPATWEEMIAAAKKCQDENDGMSGLAFHQAGAGDAAAVTYNVVNGALRRQAVGRRRPKIEGVINDAAGQKAMDVLVNQMVPLTPKGSSNWFIDEVNAAISQGQVCVGFQWIAAMGGLLDPANSELGKTKEEILEKLAFAPLPKQDTDLVPLGGMGLHVSKYIPEEKQAEALNFIKWFQTAEAQKKWAQLGGVPARNDVLELARVPRGARRGTTCTKDSVPRLRDFWNLPEYAKLLNVHSTAGQRRDQRHPGARRRPWTSWPRTSRRSWTRAASKQRSSREAGPPEARPLAASNSRRHGRHASNTSPGTAGRRPARGASRRPALPLADRRMARRAVHLAGDGDPAVPLDRAADLADPAVLHGLLGDPRCRLQLDRLRELHRRPDVAGRARARGHDGDLRRRRDRPADRRSGSRSPT